MKKLIALLLAVAMVACLFVGCSSSNETPTDPPSNGNNNTDTKAPETQTPTPAGEIPTITWYQVGGGQPANIAEWTEIVNAYLEEKIGVHLNLQVVSWGDWGDKRTMLVQTNGDWDMIFTDMSGYVTGYNMNAYADLTDYLADYPDLMNLMPAEYYDAVKLDGRIYAFPAYKDSSMSNYFIWTKEYVDAYYPDYANCHGFDETTTACLKAITEGTGQPAFLMNKDGISCVVGQFYDNMGTGLIPLGVKYGDETGTVVSVFEQADTIERLKVIQSWMDAGYINSDAATRDEASGMCGVGIGQGWPSAAKGWGSGRGAEVVVSQLGETVLSNDTVQGSMTCVNASCKYIDKCVALINLINTDSKLRDMLCYGVEGVNFEYVQEDDGTKVHKINQDWTAASYTQGTTMILTPEEGTPAGTYTVEIRGLNENAIASPALGFYFDTSSVADQVAACQATFSEWKSVLFTGTGDVEQIAKNLVADLYADGFQDVIDEAQRQLDVYLGK